MKLNILKSASAKQKVYFYAPFFALFLFLLYACLTFNGLGAVGDEHVYAMKFAQSGLINLSVENYLTWTSRTLIDAVLILFAVLPFQVWSFTNALLMTLCVFTICKVVNTGGLLHVNLAVICAFLCIKWQYMSTAGWIATTTNYLWPATFGIFSIAILHSACAGKKVTLPQYVFSCFAIIYSANMEQNLLFHLIFLLALTAYLIITKTRLHSIIFAHLAMCGVCGAYALLSPGAAARYSSEVASYFPDWAMRSALRNIELALSSSMRLFIFERDYIFTCFCIFLFAAVWQSQKNYCYRLIAAVPLLCTLVFGFFKDAVLAVLPILSFVPNSVTPEGIITFANSGNFLSHIPFLVICATLSCIIISLYLAFGHCKGALLAILIFCTGFATIAAIGFTPTVWVSSLRTALIFMLCLVALIGKLACKLAISRRISTAVCYTCTVIFAAIGCYNLISI